METEERNLYFTEKVSLSHGQQNELIREGSGSVV
jgi:hypothetical protein